MGEGVRRAGDYAQTGGKKFLEGASIVAETTEGTKKFFQIMKGFAELICTFVPAADGALSPVLSAAKVVSVVVSGGEIVGRVKEWTIPDKNGETMIHKHWAKIVSRIYLAFAHVIDFIKMLQFFNVFKYLKLSFIVQSLGRVYFFRVVFEAFPPLDAVKNVFIFFSAQWSIFDTSMTMYRKSKEMKHIKHKMRKWEILRNRNLGRQAEFFEHRAEKYYAKLEKYEEMSPKDRAKAIKKLSRSARKKILSAERKAPIYEKLAIKIQKGELSEKSYERLDAFMHNKSEKWREKTKVIKLDFVKGGVSIVCEVAKIGVVVFATIIIFTGVGAVVGVPVVLICLGLVSNGFSLFKFLFDKLMPVPSVRKVSFPKLRFAAATA